MCKYVEQVVARARGAIYVVRNELIKRVDLEVMMLVGMLASAIKTMQ